jgi:hypothetical protein
VRAKRKGRKEHPAPATRIEAFLNSHRAIINEMKGTIVILAVLLFAIPRELAAQFEYDSTRPFDVTCEPLTPRVDATVRGCRFTGPRGGVLSFLLITPMATRPPFAGAIFQHGGGQTMFDYMSEALILTRVGVVSIIPDAPARGDTKESELNRLKLQEAKDFQAEIVIAERRILDFLLQQPGVDAKRIAYRKRKCWSMAGTLRERFEVTSRFCSSQGLVQSFGTRAKAQAVRRSARYLVQRRK